MGATLPRGSERQSLLLEAVLTAILTFVITAVATDTRAVGQAAAIAIGGTVGLEALFAGPMLGAIAGVLAYRSVRGDRNDLAGLPA